MLMATPQAPRATHTFAPLAAHPTEAVVRARVGSALLGSHQGGVHPGLQRPQRRHVATPQQRRRALQGGIAEVETQWEGARYVCRLRRCSRHRRLNKPRAVGHMSDDVPCIQSVQACAGAFTPQRHHTHPLVRRHSSKPRQALGCPCQCVCDGHRRCVVHVALLLGTRSPGAATGVMYTQRRCSTHQVVPRRCSAEAVQLAAARSSPPPLEVVTSDARRCARGDVFKP